jgi:DNA-binding MarR family transcriptional regulator
MARLENLLGAYSLTVTDRVLDDPADGLSASDQASLVTLLAHPDRPVSWLGGVLGLTSSGATRLVDRLVRAGWVTRNESGDSRERLLRLTASGKRRARRALRDRDDVLASSVAGLTDVERADLEKLMERLVTGLATTRLPGLHTCRLCDRDACATGDHTCPLDHTVTRGEPLD